MGVHGIKKFENPWYIKEEYFFHIFLYIISISFHTILSVYMHFWTTSTRQLSSSLCRSLYFSSSHSGECGRMCVLWESPASFCQEELSLADRWTSGNVSSESDLKGHLPMETHMHRHTLFPCRLKIQNLWQSLWHYHGHYIAYSFQLH